MTNSKAAPWTRGDFFMLERVQYDAGKELLPVQFRNGDVVQIPTAELWRNRPGTPVWSTVCVDPDVCGALLVTTAPGSPTIEGDIAEIPGDVIRAATNSSYREFVDGFLRSREVGK